MKGQICILNQNISFSINIVGGSHRHLNETCTALQGERRTGASIAQLGRFSHAKAHHKCLIKGRGFLKSIEASRRRSSFKVKAGYKTHLSAYESRQQYL